MKNTGTVVHSALGTVDRTKGEFRKVQAFSDALGYYLASTKVSDAVNVFYTDLHEHIGKVAKEDSAKYISVLKTYKDPGDKEPFIDFMQKKYAEMLKSEITLYKEAQTNEFPINLTEKNEKSKNSSLKH
jgi:hypothetical protein